MIVLSLFDGISCGQVALDNLGIKPSKYYASEIDKHAINITQHNYPNTVQLGDVNLWEDWNIPWESIDIVYGGNPCTSWSSSGKQLGINDPRGQLFYTMLDVMENVLKHNPNAKYMIENVQMKSDFAQFFSDNIEKRLGNSHKILINSGLVSAQTRNRYYWTNFEVWQPKSLNISFKDIIEDYDTVKGDLYVGSIVGRKLSHRNTRDDYNKDLPITQCIQVKVDGDKSPTVTTVQKDIIVTNIPSGRHPLWKKETLEMFEEKYDLSFIDSDYYSWEDRGRVFRYLTIIEAERLQTLPDNYTLVIEDGKQIVSDSQRYKAIGNGWTVKVIEHILKNVV